MDIGARIREHRAAAGMKQDELAQACFVSRQTISNWERNRTLPDIESLKAIAGIFGTTVDALIGDDAPAIVEQADEEARRLVSLWVASFAPRLPCFS
ncbi:helix-turn-helix domain-containing protein [Collinsella intestinalis]|uniref:helix-turn-helix domain-containing protein n=1 Tax=Collinsella intestinalis TaxID=147207 RepID=UPI001956C7CD|nr:helix-turn-helix transcriptional regulator [Collinsella intestinalis]MBM6683283.1 helix-turn-helix transcriptional regulator [Collinsella intestinalis]